MTELKPCPFCGGKAGIAKTHKDGFTIRCEKCRIGWKQRVIKYSMETDKNTAKRPQGRPRLNDRSLCAHDGYTIPVELRDRFRERTDILGDKRSELIRGWIEWYLKETRGDVLKAKRGGRRF